MAELPTISFQVANARYTVAMGELTPRDARDFRQVVGIPLLNAFDGVADLDVIAGLVWLIRRRTNTRLRFEEVLDSFTYDDFEPAPSDTVEPAEPGEAGADPPA